VESAAQAVREGEKETGRLEAFSDGVFAIAMTLLALDLQVPHVDPSASRWALAEALARQWPSYIAFITSFFTVLIMWVNHHTMFKMVRRVNIRVLFANGFLLMLTTAVPFTTALVSTYYRTPGAKVACAVYTGTFVLVSVAYNWIWFSLVNHRELLKSDASERTIEKLSKNYWLGIPAYLIATAIAFVDVRASIGLCSALWIFWAATAREV
jgi:uncharacterized membrane protein